MWSSTSRAYEKRAGIAPHAVFCCPGSYRRSALAARVAGSRHVVQVIERGLRRFGADPHAQGRRTVTNLCTYLGLDVHKETIAVAIADGRSSDGAMRDLIRGRAVAVKTFGKHGSAFKLSMRLKLTEKRMRR
jgi:hypothetical protein